MIFDDVNREQKMALKSENLHTVYPPTPLMTPSLLLFNYVGYNTKLVTSAPFGQRSDLGL